MGERLYPERLNMDNNNTDENNKIQSAYEKMLNEGAYKNKMKSLDKVKKKEKKKKKGKKFQDQYADSDKFHNEGLIEGKKLKFPKTEDEARDQAVQWQDEFSSKSMSWGDVLDAGQHFEKTAKKFGLTKEFKENGII